MRTVFAAIACVMLGASSHAQIARLGIMGDSLSDEYFEEDYSYAKNWDTQLVLYRAVDVGALPASSWGEPRRTGYRYNWARAGASSGTMISQGQHTGLAGQISPTGVTHAVLFIGANDFQPNYDGPEYAAIYNNTWSQSQLDTYINQRLNNVNTVLNTVLAKNVKLVLVNFMDWSIQPSAWTNPSYTDPAKRQRVTNAVERVNAGIRAIARTRRLPLVDVYAFHTAVFGTNTGLKQFLKLGNVNLKLWEADTTTNTNKTAAFVDDLVHPHTTIQGCYANLILTAFNAAYHTDAVLFTESEILSHAGIGYGGSDTLEGQIGPFTKFVTNYTCPGDYVPDGFVDAIDYDRFIVDWLSLNVKADFNLDGFIDAIDYDQFIAAFVGGC